jgi:RNA polymerase sigma-54 factor
MLTHSHLQSLHQIPTAHLAQTMSLLELNWDELRQKIENELGSNPALEITETHICPACHHRINSSGPCQFCSNRKDGTPDSPIIFISPRFDFSLQSRFSETQDNPIDMMVEKVDLPLYVLRQIGSEIKPEDRKIATHILSGINEDGLLTIPISEIALYHHVPKNRIENILNLIKYADPVGVGSSKPQEALLIQIELLSETNHVPEFTREIVSESMDLLSRRSVVEISKKYNISINHVNEIIRFISENLNPYPGRAYWGENGSSPQVNTYTIPDIIVTRQNQEEETALIIEILSPYTGNLRVNPLFKEALSLAPEEKIQEWQKALESAILLVKCLQQRNQAMLRLIQRLVVLQRNYFLKGDAWLLPITRAQLADELNVHESTISRAVSKKSIQLPNRKIVPLSKLFDRSLQIRTTLKEIISKENHPFSDTELVDLLNKQGFPVARRTVAKYRAMEGILPARFRQMNPS